MHQSASYPTGQSQTFLFLTLPLLLALCSIAAGSSAPHWLLPVLAQTNTTTITTTSTTSTSSSSFSSSSNSSIKPSSPLPQVPLPLLLLSSTTSSSSGGGSRTAVVQH
jgi:hypothetical protein